MTSKRHRYGFSVTVFLPTGDPEGIKVVEKSNWSGRGLVIPRSIFLESRDRSELESTGVYLLFGPSETSPLPMLYVGEGDPIKPRLTSHYNDDSKAFWTHAVGFTSKDNNLNKAHIKHLESRLIALAKEAKRSELTNANQPNPPSLSEVDQSVAEAFLDDMLLCLPILGYSVFERGCESGSAKQPEPEGQTLTLTRKGIEARGREVAAGFLVQAGSYAVGNDQVTDSLDRIYPAVTKLRDSLINQGVLVPDGKAFRFEMDYTFSSPSFASTLVTGSRSNGRVMWVADDGRTLKEVQEAEAGL